MKIFTISLFIGAITTAFSQADTTKTLGFLDSIVKQNPWRFKAITGINGSQTAFVNWAAGGRNNISMLGFIDATAKYKKGDYKWDTDFKYALGGLLYTDSTGKSEGLQKTDDRIDLASAFGYEFKKKWFYSATAGFRTQTLEGFAFPNDSVRISKFLAPAYVSFSLGIEYVPSPALSVYLSPLAAKITIVNDQVLANAGAFGVDPAVYDASGLILSEGKRVRYEFGAYFRFKFERTIAKNVEMKTRLELFSNYLNNPQNIDVNAENIFNFKINDWFSASLQWNLQYDDDIDIIDRNGNTGPRTQFKSVLGLGISYTIID
jgi:hypothetical protein